MGRCGLGFWGLWGGRLWRGLGSGGGSEVGSGF